MTTKPPREPENLKSAMNAWRQGFGIFPTAYSDYHKQLAEARRDELVEKYGVRVVEEQMINDGWGDGFCVLNIVVVTSYGWPVALKWNDGNRDFMVKCKEGGHAFFNPERTF